MLTQITAWYATTIRVFMFALAALLLPVGLSACSEDESPGSTLTPTPSSAATPTQSTAAIPAPEDMADPELAAVAAFERFMNAFVAASAVPDPSFPDLANAASGDALAAITDAVQIKLDRGERSEGEPAILEITVKESSLETDPVQVALTTCQDSTGWVVVDAASGEPVAGEEYGRRQIEALVEPIDGHWYVTELAVQGLGSCLPKPAA